MESKRAPGGRHRRAPSTIAGGVTAAVIAGLLVLVAAPAAGAQTGRTFTSDDWSDKIPIVIGAIFVVILVNSVGMYFVKRSRDHERDAGLA